MNPFTPPAPQCASVRASGNEQNEAAFVRDCIAFNEERNHVNPYVGSWTCYGIPYHRVQPLLTAHGVFHGTYNPKQ